jgi:hypothetical protein
MDIATATFTGVELEQAFGLRRDDLANWVRFGYLPARNGQPVRIGYAARAYLFDQLTDHCIVGPAAKVAAEVLAPVVVKQFHGGRPRLVFVDHNGRIIPVPGRRLTELPVSGPIGIVVDVTYVAKFIREALENIVKDRRC